MSTSVPGPAGRPAPALESESPAEVAPQGVAAWRASREGELIAAMSALLLLIVMFALKWYGVVRLPHAAERSGSSSAVNAWTQLAGLRWLMLLIILVCVGAVVLHASQRTHGAQTDTGVLIAGLGALTAALLANRILIDLPASSSVVDVKIGGYLGLLCAVGIALGGYQTIREERARNERVSPERRG